MDFEHIDKLSLNALSVTRRTVAASAEFPTRCMVQVLSVCPELAIIGKNAFFALTGWSDSTRDVNKS